MAGFRIIVFSSMPPIEPYLLMDRLEKAVAGVELDWGLPANGVHSD